MTQDFLYSWYGLLPKGKHKNEASQIPDGPTFDLRSSVARGVRVVSLWVKDPPVSSSDFFFGNKDENGLTLAEYACLS